jgi:hypothetical protein
MSPSTVRERNATELPAPPRIAPRNLSLSGRLLAVWYHCKSIDRCGRVAGELQPPDGCHGCRVGETALPLGIAATSK